jgi:hypothetical protein
LCAAATDGGAWIRGEPQQGEDGPRDLKRGVWTFQRGEILTSRLNREPKKFSVLRQNDLNRLRQPFA